MLEVLKKAKLAAVEKAKKAVLAEEERKAKGKGNPKGSVAKKPAAALPPQPVQAVLAKAAGRIATTRRLIGNLLALHVLRLTMKRMKRRLTRSRRRL